MTYELMNNESPEKVLSCRYLNNDRINVKSDSNLIKNRQSFQQLNAVKNPGLTVRTSAFTTTKNTVGVEDLAINNSLVLNDNRLSIYCSPYTFMDIKKTTFHCQCHKQKQEVDDQKQEFDSQA